MALVAFRCSSRDTSCCIRSTLSLRPRSSLSAAVRSCSMRSFSSASRSSRCRSSRLRSRRAAIFSPRRAISSWVEAMVCRYSSIVRSRLSRSPDSSCHSRSRSPRDRRVVSSSAWRAAVWLLRWEISSVREADSSRRPVWSVSCAAICRRSSAASASWAAISCSLAAMAALASAIRPWRAVSSPSKFSIVLSSVVRSRSNCPFSPRSRSTASSAARRWPWATSRAYWAAVSSRLASSAALAASSSFWVRPSFLCRRAFSSLARDRMPALRLTLPPVMEPPRLMTWPSRVTMRKRFWYFRAMAMPQSKSSAITVRPRRFLKMLS